LTVNAVMLSPAANAIHLVLSSSSHAASADGVQLFDMFVDAETAIGVLRSAPPSDAASSRNTRPSFVAAATTSLPLTGKITGDVENVAPGIVNESLTVRLFGSSATIAFAYVCASADAPAAWSPSATNSVPVLENAIDPTGLAPEFHEVAA